MSTHTLEKPVVTPSHLPLLKGPTSGEDGKYPDWFLRRQLEAWGTFSSLPFPDRRNEKWRFSNLKLLDLETLEQAPALPSDLSDQLVERSEGLETAAASLVFANDQLVSHRSLPEELSRKGVIFAPLEEAMEAHEELFTRYFMTQAIELGSEKFAALHEAFVRSGVLLYVPKGVEVEFPLEVWHWLAGERASVFPHTLLILEEQSRVTLIDRFESAADEPGFSCGVNDLFVGQGASLTYVCCQNWGPQVGSVQINSTVAGRDASALSLNLHLGSRYSRVESTSRLEAEGARSDMLALTVADRQQEFDLRTLQHHLKPHGTSDLLYKNALYDQARTIFSGLIKVDPNAVGTDAYQKVRNLMLSDEAEANSMPGLEILADDVRCTHGATSGQISEEELFYLMSRGLPEKTAKKLVVQGFLAEVLKRLPNRDVADHLQSLIERR